MLTEKYRPKTWDEFVGNTKAVACIRRIVERPGFTGDAFLIHGPSGIGKTSAARIMAAHVSDPSETFILDGQACDVDAVRDAVDLMRYRTMTGRLRTWIVNECHAMSPKAVQAWLTTLDPCPPGAMVVFTTTEDKVDLFGEFSSPFTTRCKVIRFTSQGLAQLAAAHVQRIAQAEGLDGQDIGRYLRLVQSENNSIRGSLNKVEMGVMVA